MFTKILTWVRMNGATVLAAIQVVIKLLKELATGVVNVLSIFMPAMKAEAIILKIRSVGEAIDGWIEKIKAWLLAIVL